MAPNRGLEAGPSAPKSLLSEDPVAVSGLYESGDRTLGPSSDVAQRRTLIMRSSFDFSPYRRSTIGFDRLFEFLESASREQADNYPPYDIEKLSDDRYRITLAVAGFGENDIDITARQNMLVVTGRKAENRNRDGNFVHVGIATRAFERRFELADFVRVEDAVMQDGLLSVELVREIPEAMRPRKISINGHQAAPIESEKTEATQVEAQAEKASEAA
jgi:molecular chaperone IbpA